MGPGQWGGAGPPQAAPPLLSCPPTPTAGRRALSPCTTASLSSAPAHHSFSGRAGSNWLNFVLKVFFHKNTFRPIVIF